MASAFAQMRASLVLSATYPRTVDPTPLGESPISCVYMLGGQSHLNFMSALTA